MIFVCGNSRSGTTLTARILDKNSQCLQLNEIHLFDELQFCESNLTRVYQQLMNRHYNGYFAKKEPAYTQYDLAKKPSAINEVIDLFKAKVKDENGVSYLIDQTPANIRYIDTIRNYYPDSKFIVLIRDPRDVILSQKGRWKRKFKGAPLIPYREAIRAYINHNTMLLSKMWMANYRAIESQDVYLLKYEHLLANPETEVRNICDYLRIPFEQAMLDIEAKGSSTHTDGQKRGFVKDNYNKWKQRLSRREAQLIEHYTQEAVLKYGYETTQLNNVTIQLSILYEYLVLILKSPLLLLFNRHRLSDLIRHQIYRKPS